MSREDTIQLIESSAKKANAFDELETHLEVLSRDDLSQRLLGCGVIPERFEHDSSEEKLWAKYCDILLSKTLNCLNIEAQVIRARGDSADVFGKTDDYTIVGDAKAFRLSRTAKNQKDFKVTALDDWRKGNTFACLVAPLYQYPIRASQIYTQAKERNVTLISYIHLRFLLDHPPEQSLIDIWRVAGNLTPSKDARIYWESIDDMLVGLTNTSYELLRTYKRLEATRTREIGNDSIEYWQSIIASYRKLSQEEAVTRLIKAEKIEQKIEIIQRTVSKVATSYD